MRYRWIAAGIILVGFMTITYQHNEHAQAILLQQVAAPAGDMSPTSDTYAWLDEEVTSLKEMRALLDTLDAVGFRTELGASLRTRNRTSLEQMERLRLLTWLQDTMWRQTIYNLIWGVFGAVVLLPIAFWLDGREPKEPAAPSAGGDPGPGER